MQKVRALVIVIICCSKAYDTLGASLVNDDFTAVLYHWSIE